MIFFRDYCPVEIKPESYNKNARPRIKARLSAHTKQMYCSSRYQRRNGAWSVRQKCKYIENVFRGRVFTPVIVANVTDEDRNLDCLPRTIKYACLDGQQSTAIAQFINNEFGFTGTINGEVFNNTPFSKLDDDIRMQFLMECTIPVFEVPEDVRDLASVFIDVNFGIPLNKQEMRNAISSYIASWVRSQSESFREVFNQVQGVKYDRMDDCVLIARIALMLTGLHNKESMATANADLDRYYNLSEEDEYDSNVLNYISTELLPALKIVASSHKNNKNSKIKTRNLFAFVFVHAALAEHKPGHSISPDALYSWCKETIEDLDIKHTTKYVKDERRLGRDNISKNDYFHIATRNIQPHEQAKTFRKHIFSSFKNNLDNLVERLEEKDSQASEEERSFDDVSLLEALNIEI